MPIYNTCVHTETHSILHTDKHRQTSFSIRLCEFQLEELSHSSEQRCTVERDLYLFYIPCKVYIDIVNVFRPTVKNAYILTREENKLDNHTSAMPQVANGGKLDRNQSIQEKLQTHDSGWDFQDTCHFSHTE